MNRKQFLKVCGIGLIVPIAAPFIKEKTNEEQIELEKTTTRSPQMRINGEDLVMVFERDYSLTFCHP